MALDTYTNLQTAIANELARSDLTSYIPDFITLAEAEFNSDLNHRLMDQRATATVNTAATEPQYISLPGDFNMMRWLRLNGVSGKPTLEYMTVKQIDEYTTFIGDATGQPEFYTIFGDEMQLAPSPDSAYTLEILYRKNIPALASNSTNWLLTAFPNLYLYGALKHSAPFMKDDERLPLWQGLYDRAIASINQQNIGAAFNGSPVTIRVATPTP
ncbi:MAG: hypothetical protein ACM3IH_14115 [Sphingobacteriales bacterium]